MNVKASKYGLQKLDFEIILHLNSSVGAYFTTEIHINSYQFQTGLITQLLNRASATNGNALVICNHGPPPPGNSGDFDFSFFNPLL